MNAYFDKNRNFNSNNRTYNSYFETQAKPAIRLRTVLEALLTGLLALLSILCGARARVLIRVTAVAIAFVGFIGVIGAVEHGSLTMLGGVLIGSLLIGLEYLALRGSKKQAKKN